MVSNNKRLQFRLVAAVLLLGIAITILLLAFKPSAQRVAVDYKPPQVDILLAVAQDIHIPVHSQGNVQAKTQIKIAAEVTGKIDWVSDTLIDNGYFDKAERLLAIDDTEYKLLITKAEAQVAAGRQLLARSEAEADQARKDLQRLGRKTADSTEYALRIPHLKEARANLKAAEADLSIARLQQQRTEILAPFAGRLIKKYVDVGQFVAPGNPLLDIYSTEAAETRIPLTQNQLSLLRLPDNRSAENAVESASQVLVSAYFAGENWRWTGQLVRTEGVIDERNRMVYAVVQIDQPNQADPEQPGRPALTSGQFVKVTIQGRPQQRVYVLPRSALRYGRELWLVDNDNRLQKRQVGVLHKEKMHVYIDSGLTPGERVITSSLDIAIDNMRLEPQLQASSGVSEAVQ
ncbi:MAG: efflux RND transporter periplasmic adaptor subunit [Gammaproteobacteria bacterium]